MFERNLTNVSAAFERLLEEIEADINRINEVGVKAFEGRDYDRAREPARRANSATALRDKVVTLRGEWETLTVAQAERRDVGRLQRGLRTPEKAYYQFILKALNEFGGSAEMNDVLTRVEQLMRGVLRPVDYEFLASDPGMPRWRNTAQWARNSMVKEGLLKPNSPWGIWEIT